MFNIFYILIGYMSKKNIEEMQTKNKGQKKNLRPNIKKADRFIQASILLALKDKPSYGYELLQNIYKFGFIEGQAPPGMIYRHLRDMEDNGWVISEWQTDEGGPAKRMYQLTTEGEEVLSSWISYMGHLSKKLLAFIEMYQDLVQKV
jgi:PadR family transcriptional regulator, regulatory protein PadR